MFCAFFTCYSKIWLFKGKCDKALTHTSYQRVFPGRTVPQSHAIISPSREDVEAVPSEAQAIHSAIMGCVY